MGVEVEGPGRGADERRSRAGLQGRRLTGVLVALAAVGSLVLVGARAESSSAEEAALEFQLQQATASLRTQALAAGDVGVVVELDVQADASPEAVGEAAEQLLDDVDPVAGTAAVLDNIGVVTLRTDAEGLDALAASDAVRRVEPDRLLAPALAVSAAQIGAPAAHNAGFTGAGTAVAVLDSGVDRTHPALAGQVAYEACFTNGSCPNGQNTQVNQVGAAAPCAWGDGCEHGTHVAGVVASTDPQYRGIAPGAKIAAVQVFSAATGASCGGRPTCARARTSDVLAALDHLVDAKDTLSRAGIRLVAANLSLSSDVTAESCDESVLKGAVDRLRVVGISTVVAAGNAGDKTRLGIPSCISTTLSVGAVDQAGAYWTVSNFGRNLDLLAPGVNVTSTWPGGTFRPASGTSTAAPHVAASLALVAQALPNADLGEREKWLVDNGTPVVGPEQVSKPAVNLAGLAPRFQTASAEMTGGLVPVLGDYDGNGITDIFFFDPQGARSELWWYNGDGSVSKTPSTMGGDFRPVAGDFNGDGADDMLWYSPTGASWYWFWTKGARQILGWNGPWYPFGDYRLVSGNLNGDATDDIVFYNTATGMAVYYWNQRTTGPLYAIPTAQLAPSPGGGFRPHAGDLNGDGADDLLWTNGSAKSQIWWYRAGGGVFNISTISSWGGSVALGRFDGTLGADLLFYSGGPQAYLWTAIRPGVNFEEPRSQNAPRTVPTVNGVAHGGNFFAETGSAKDEILLYARSTGSVFLR